MRYPIVNLGNRMSGMLDDYKNEINKLKSALYRGQAFSGYTPPPQNYPPAGAVPTTATPAVPQSGGARSFPPGQPPMVATGQPPAPSPNDITVSAPPAPPTFTGLDPYAPRPGVITGIPPGNTYDYPPPTYGYPKVPDAPTQKCPPGYTWTPSGCLKDVASEPNRPPMQPITNIPAATPVPTQSTGRLPGGGVNSQTSWNTAPGATNPYGNDVPSVDCGAGKFWDGRQCRSSTTGLPSLPGGSEGVTGGDQGAIPSGSGGATLNYPGMGMRGSVRLVATREQLGGPQFLGAVKLVR